MDRPSDHAARLVELVNQRGAPDVDVDRIGKANSQFGHLLRAGDDHGVIAARPGIEEWHRVEAEEISVGRRGRAERPPYRKAAAPAPGLRRYSRSVRRWRG